MHLNAMPSPPKFEHNAKVTLPFDSPHLTSLATVVSPLWSAVHELSILSASAALVFVVLVFSNFLLQWAGIHFFVSLRGAEHGDNKRVSEQRYPVILCF